MPDPVFSNEERVPPNNPPPNNPPPNNPTRVVTAPPPRNKQEFWNDPEKAVRDTVREEAARIITDASKDPRNIAAMETQLQQAKYVMKQKYGASFDKFEAEVEKIVRQTPEQGIAIGFWETAFNFVKGQAYDKAVTEAEARGRMPAEPVVPAANTPPAPKTISTVIDPDAEKSEAQVASGLGITDQSYVDSKDRMLKKGSLPFTYDTRKRRGS